MLQATVIRYNALPVIAQAFVRENYAGVE